MKHTWACSYKLHTPICVPTPDDQQPQPTQQQQLGELTVQLNEHLGDGSFGTVYKASYQGTPAAAKYLYHQVREYESFKRELETLQGLTHPNLVAYYTEIMCPGPQRRCPVLVMELMEKTLTEFLEDTENNIPVHLQVNLCLDITFALAYLHSQQIVHGHLTSNNVLLVGTTAKVADFGISKLLDTQSSVTHNALYLPPEVRISHREFSEKSDIFSLGVLIVQIVTREVPTVTREAPTPSPRGQQLDIINLGVRVVQIVMPIPQQQPVPTPQQDRRQQHIQKIASTHPLRDIALQCLKDTAMERPTAKKVITKLTAVRYHPQYVASLKQEREMTQREIVQLKSEYLIQKQENQELHKQLKDKDQKIRDAEQELQQFLENESKKVKDKDEQIQACEMEVKQLLQQIQNKDNKISELEAWKKTIKDKITSLASAARH